MSLDKGKTNKKEFAHIERVVKWISRILILIIFSPFIFYFFSKVDFEKDEKTIVGKIEVDLTIENGIDLESGLIVDSGYEIVKGVCGACHALNLVTQNSATRDGWKEIIVWMQETQKLWDLGDNEVIILDYLEKNYAPKKQGRRAALKEIDWYEL